MKHDSVIEVIKMCDPKSVVLVHGERGLMQRLQKKIFDNLKLECFVPEIGETCTMTVPIKIPANAKKFLEETKNSKWNCPHSPDPNRRPRMTNVLILRDNHVVPMTIEDALKTLNTHPYFTKYCIEYKFYDPEPNWGTINKLFLILKGKLSDWDVLIRNDRTITIKDVEVKLVKNRKNKSETLLRVVWVDSYEDVCYYILNILENMS